MCTNYVPSAKEQLESHFGVFTPIRETKLEAWPGYLEPIIRLPYDDPQGAAQCEAACFGMMPPWAQLTLFRQTYNARTETVSSKPSFRNAWKKHQFCIVPMSAFFEPNYESGKAVRWRISHAKGRPLGMAGIWEWRPDGGEDGTDLLSFSLLTINADEHPLMKRFHKPGDEKRMLVILEPNQYQDWLHATAANAMDFMVQYPPRPASCRGRPTSTEEEI